VSATNEISSCLYELACPRFFPRFVIVDPLQGEVLRTRGANSARYAIGKDEERSTKVARENFARIERRSDERISPVTGFV